MKKLKRTLALSLALILVLICTGCGKKADDTIVIGCIGPITGDNAFYGQLLKDSITLMAENCNAAGGIIGKQVELKMYDDRSDPVEVTNAARKAIQQDGVQVFIGTESSATTLALAQVCEENNIPFVTTLATNIKVTRTEDGQTRPQSFRSCLSDPQMGSIMAQYTIRELGYQSAGVIYNLGSDYSIGIMQQFTDTFENEGGTVGTSEAYNDGDVDYRAVLTKMKNAGDFDCLYIAVGYYKEAGLIAKQARELGLDQPIVSTDSMMVGKMFEITSEGVEGAIYPAAFIIDHPNVQAFLAEFTEKFGYDPSQDSAGDLVCAHDAWMMVETAITNAGSAEPTAIRDALENLGTIDSICGTLTVVPETHDTLRECPIYQIQKEEFIKIAEFKPTA